jgi:biopolymer transport protein ExbB/TolQ
MAISVHVRRPDLKIDSFEQNQSVASLDLKQKQQEQHQEKIENVQNKQHRQTSHLNLLSIIIFLSPTLQMRP